MTRSLDQLRQMFRRPAAGAAISGSVVLGAATIFGVLETTLAAGAAFVAYRAMRKRCSTERR